MAIFQNLQTDLLNLALHLGGALLIMLIGRWLAVKARDWVQKLLLKTTLTESLSELTIRATYYGILFGAALTALSVLGVPTASLVAAIGIIVVILGIALQESISNFAATVTFLLFTPFEVGDLIETGGTLGTVQEIQVLNTVLLKADRKVVVLPNSKVQADGITNYSKEPVLRIDLEVGISYDADIAEAKRVAMQTITTDSRVLTEPAPQIIVLELDDSSVNLGIRPFVSGEDYWQTMWDLREQIKVDFDEAGITIPYPQRDVHMIAEKRVEHDDMEPF